jgi:hypothetical protein
MTEGRAAAPRKSRLSHRALRAWAWIAGAIALFAPLGALAAQPKVPTTSATARRVIIDRVRRRVIVISPQRASVAPRIVYVGGGGSSGGTAPVAPATTTGGSGVPR